MDRINWWKTACAIGALGTAMAITAPAQTLTTLHTFGFTDGYSPEAPLLQATDGNLYGTTYFGGLYGHGALFQMSPSGSLSAIYSFCAQTSCPDGENPQSAVIEGADGNLYGTTDYGGANGAGTIFKSTLAGELTTPYRFCSQRGCTDGAYPVAALLEQGRNLYGTNAGGSGHEGTAFRIAGGALTTLHQFCQNGCADGYEPFGALVQGPNGDFYGTTLLDGARDGGTVFRITPGGVLTTLYTFCSQPNCVDGKTPFAGLLLGLDGNFYGTTSAGGANGNGTVFKMTPGGALTTLYSFCSQSNCTDGSDPLATLVEGTDGSLYGTTYDGGANGNYGTVFKISPEGALTTLYSFCSQSGCADGQQPYAGLVQDTNGNFYGTTGLGGTGYGTVFTLAVGLGPFVRTMPASGSVGAAVTILGTNLTGATGVSFNGTPATFSVVSSSEITATVPAGATTGTVQVVAPGGTFKSNAPFRVLP